MSPSFGEKAIEDTLFLPHSGPIAQLVEHLICNEGVSGSNPLGSTKDKTSCPAAGVLLLWKPEPYTSSGEYGEAGS